MRRGRACVHVQGSAVGYRLWAGCLQRTWAVSQAWVRCSNRMLYIWCCRPYAQVLTAVGGWSQLRVLRLRDLLWSHLSQ